MEKRAHPGSLLIKGRGGRRLPKGGKKGVIGFLEEGRQSVNNTPKYKKRKGQMENQSYSRMNGV